MAKNPQKPECEAKTDLGCNGQIVRRVKGPKKSDPEFWCCIGCRAILSRAGVRVRDVSAPEPARVPPRTRAGRRSA